jgi:hypothetical protein
LSDFKNAVNIKYSGFLSILINIPIVILFILFWIKCMGREKGIKKYFFFLPILTLIYQAIAFLMFYDYGRWMIMIITVQFMLIFYLLYTQNITVLLLAKQTSPFFQRNFFSIILICFFMVFLGPVNPIYPSDRVIRIAKGILSLFGIQGVY